MCSSFFSRLVFGSTIFDTDLMIVVMLLVDYSVGAASFTIILSEVVLQFGSTHSVDEKVDNHQLDALRIAHFA